MKFLITTSERIPILSSEEISVVMLLGSSDIALVTSEQRASYACCHIAQGLSLYAHADNLKKTFNLNPDRQRLQVFSDHDPILPLETRGSDLGIMISHFSKEMINL